MNKIKCAYLCIDNFYNDPYKIRDFVLKQDFKIRGNYPGKRTVSFASEDIKETMRDSDYSVGDAIALGMKSKNWTYQQKKD